MLYFDLTSLTVVVVVVLPVLAAVVTVGGKGVGIGAIALLLLLRLVGPDSKSVLGFLLTGLPSLVTLTMSPPCSLCCCC